MCIERMLEQNVIRPSKKLAKISLPMQEYFGVEHFFISKLTAAGLFTIVGGDIEVNNEFYHSKYYVHSPFYRHPKDIQQGIYLYRNIPGKKYQESINSIAKKVQVEFCMVIVVKQGEDLIRFGYGAKPERASQTINLMLNHLPMIIKFNQHYVEEAKDIISLAYENFIDLHDYIPQFELQTNCKTALHADEKLNFLRAIHRTQDAKVFDLSAQEKQCLRYLHKGCTATQIAREMHLSSRTVEHYLENIKNKLNCLSKQELFHYAALLERYYEEQLNYS